MAIPQKYAKLARCPTSKDQVYKEESVLSFDNPETEGGLYVCLNSFLSVGRRHLSLFSQVYDGKLFLNVRRTRTKTGKRQQEDGSETKKPTRLAIGVEGGFPADGEVYSFHDEYRIVYYDGQEHEFQFGDEKLQENVVKSAEEVIAASASLVKLMLPDNNNVGWSGDLRKESRFSETLEQIKTNRTIPPSGWKCDKCGLESNLWLNLTDGSILCGRRYFDGTGGNNHALEHYEETKYPLAVKLGTIGEGSNPDVFSYPEDDIVIDTKLDEHLAFWGIRPHLMSKTDKTMLEMEIDINQRANEHWGMARICESDGELKFVAGKGLTPLHNIGSSCYMNVVLQVLFSIKQLQERYFEKYDEILAVRSPSPVDDLELQTAKMADGLLSGLYSDKERYPTGIRPYMFKRVISKNHQEFRTTQQQDAAEFFLYCLDEIRKSCLTGNKLSVQMDPTECFRFLLEERNEYVNSRKCCYCTCEEFALQIPIDVDLLTQNVQDVINYQEQCELLEKEGVRTDSLEAVEPVISLLDCINQWQKAELIENATVPGSKPGDPKDQVLRRFRFKTFPEHLVLTMKRFGVNPDWTPKKLQVRLQVPDVIDLKHLKATGPKSGEDVIEKDDGLSPELQRIIPELMEFGFPEAACRKALATTKAKESAVEWLLEHGHEFTVEFSDVDEPPSELMANLTSMGFRYEQAKTALQQTSNNLERAIDWLFSHPESAVAPGSDGEGVYELWAFISHIGRSAMSGHYVAHIKKQLESTQSWVIFDDERVALSANPPKEYGYIYFFRRVGTV